MTIEWGVEECGDEESDEWEDVSSFVNINIGLGPATQPAALVKGRGEVVVVGKLDEEMK